jgi:hypothetical protein
MGMEQGNLNNSEVIFRIKTAFAASFHSKAILIQRDVTKDIERRIAILQGKKLNPDRCLTLENVNIDCDRLQPKMVADFRDRIALIFEEYCEIHSLTTK